jgi:hypothetical protein
VSEFRFKVYVHSEPLNIITFNAFYLIHCTRKQFRHNSHDLWWVTGFKKQITCTLSLLHHGQSDPLVSDRNRSLHSQKSRRSFQYEPKDRMSVIPKNRSCDTGTRVSCAERLNFPPPSGESQDGAVHPCNLTCDITTTVVRNGEQFMVLRFALTYSTIYLTKLRGP